MLTYPHAPAQDVWPAPPVLPSGPPTAPTVLPPSRKMRQGDGGWGELLACLLARWRRHRSCAACARVVYIPKLVNSPPDMLPWAPRPASTAKITCASKLATQIPYEMINDAAHSYAMSK
eukprot:1348004-Pleurochrysis_carterae.AAC.1